MIKIANNLQRLVKAANNPTPAEQEAAMRQIMGLTGINPQLSENMIGPMQQTQLQNQAMGMTPEQAQFASPEAIQGRMAQRNIVNKLPFTRAFDSPPETTSTTYSGVLPKPHIVSPVDVDIIGAWIRQALNGPQHLSSTMPQVRLPQPFSPSMISTTPPAQFTPSPAQQQFAQTAMGIPQEQAQFASPEAVRARMSARNQRHTPAPNLMSSMPKPDYRKF